jgi:hypothetical protein
VFDTVVAVHGRRLCLLAALLTAACDDSTSTLLPLSVLAPPPACEPQQGCDVAGDDLSLRVHFDAVPRALQPFPVSVYTDSDAPVDAVMVTFLMRGMDMGLNRYRLQGDAQAGWTGRVTLPVCVSGRSDWIAEFELHTALRNYRVQIPFVLQK